MTANIVALYIRLSMEDSDLDAKKSLSISVQNQKAHIWNFLVEHPNIKSGEVREFIDDGYTGTNFDRPAMTELLELVRLGEIRCIIVKDFSRFGRNYLEVGNYLEQIFPCLNVRFISVDDNYDSDRAKGDVPGLDVVFKNIIHDYYSKELSGKVIQTRRNLAKKGLFMGGIPPFGYLRSAENKYKLVIDPISAKSVRMIYDMRLEGKEYSEIARILNKSNIESPAQRLWRIGIRKGNMDEKAVNEIYWRSDTVSRILSNPVVIGCVTNHRVERKQLGRASLKPVKPSEQIIVQNMHDAIIDKTVYNRVQKMNNSINRTEKGIKEGKIYPLSGVVKCGCCGRNLLIEGKQVKRYVCKQARVVANEKHEPIAVREEIILNILVNILAVSMKLLYQPPDRVGDKELDFDDTNMNANNNRQLIRKKLLSDAYEEYASGNISKEKFLVKKRKIHEKFQETLMEICDRAIEGQEKTMSQIHKIANTNDTSWLTKGLIQDVIKEIRICADNKIDIVWKCDDWINK